MRTSKRINVSDRDGEELKQIVRNGNTPQKVALRARIVLLSGDGISTGEIMHQLDTTTPTISRWRNRYETDGIPGLLKDRSRAGRKRRIEETKVREVVDRTLQEEPSNATHWSTRTLAAVVGLSPASIQRIWKAHGLKPHRVRTFKLSRDSLFVEKLQDVVGLYLNPPEHALVLSVDEKSQIQALDRTQPLLPMGLGYVEGVTHDYIRHGTTTLFAALDIATGQVLTSCKNRHRHQEYLQFLKQVDASVPPELGIHLVVDNYSTHKHPEVKRWLAAHPRYHVHYTPTYASWLNQVEIWFNIITQRAIRRGTFKSVKALIAKIEYFVNLYNQNSRPFAWTATADSVLEKVRRLCQLISETGH